MSKFTKLKHDWTLIDEGVFAKTDAHNYRLVPPKWSVNFWVSESQTDERRLDEEVRRAGEMLVDEILRNPFVKEAVDRLTDHARWEGYEGAYQEVQTGKRYEFEQEDL